MTAQLTIPEVAPPDDEPLPFELEELLYLLGDGPDKATSRKDLVREMDLQDRHIRRLIARLRGAKKLILTHGRGYYRLECPDTIDAIEAIPDEVLDDLERWFWPEWKKATALIKNLRYARRILKIRGRWKSA